MSRIFQDENMKDSPFLRLILLNLVNPVYSIFLALI